jgi:hypothetical protein
MKARVRRSPRSEFQGSVSVATLSDLPAKGDDLRPAREHDLDIDLGSIQPLAAASGNGHYSRIPAKDRSQH